MNAERFRMPFIAFSRSGAALNVMISGLGCFMGTLLGRTNRNGRRPMQYYIIIPRSARQCTRASLRDCG